MEEEIEEIKSNRVYTQDQRPSTGWFGGFGTTTLSKVGAMFSGSAEKSAGRSNSPRRDGGIESAEETKDSVNLSQHVSLSFVTPTKGESNSDYVRDSSGGRYWQLSIRIQ